MKHKQAGEPTATATVRSEPGQLAELLAQVSADLESGTPIDWQAIYAQFPEHSKELDEIRPAMEALQNLKLHDSQDGSLRGSGIGDHHPRNLGDFRILHEIGRGGMGLVYEAEQISIPRRVALKILPLAELIDEKALLRFKNEVTAIATLEHPHIVSVYSIGEERGVHYYAMQLVQGQSLAAVIRELKKRTQANESVTSQDIEGVISDQQFTNPDHPDRGLDDTSVEPDADPNRETIARGRTATARITDPNYFRRIVRLILPVADALQHAHDQGIVHRDVKPGNLLLDKSGRLFITDFGLARIDAGAGVTMTGDVLGTLRYMSPEQMSGKSGLVDQRTDIYSLGATLYEALTLQPMFRGENRAELVNQVSSEEPTPLRNVNPSLPEDLETIVLKAINKDPLDRYETATDLAADLNRFLENIPIEARRPKLTEKLSKWAYRHRSLVAVAMAALLLIALTAFGSAVLIWNASQKEAAAFQERERALEQTKLSNQRRGILDDFILRNIITAAYPGDEGGDPNITVREAVLQARDNIDETFEDDLLLRSHTHTNIGKYCNAMGEYEIARDELLLAIEGYRELIRGDVKEPLQAYLVETLQDLVDVYWGLEQWDEALSTARDALAISRDTNLAISRNTVSQLWRIGATYNKQRKLEKAEQVLQEAAELAKNQGFTKLKALIRLEQGNMNFYQQKYDAAKTFWQEALATFESSGDNEYNIMITRYNLGNLFWQTGEKEKSIDFCRDVLEEMTASRGPLYPFALQVLGTLADRQRMSGDLKTAETNYRLLLQRRAERFGDESEQVAAALVDLGVTLGDLGRPEQAVELQQRALEIEKKLFGANHLRVIHRGSQLANALSDVGRSEEAANYYREAIDRRRAMLADKPEDWQTARSLAADCCNFGILLRDEMEDLPNALGCFNEAIELLTVVHRDHPTDLSATFLANNLLGRAATWIKLGDKAKFSEDMDQAIELRTEPSTKQEFRLTKAYYLAEVGDTDHALEIVDNELPLDEDAYKSYLVGQVFALFAGHVEKSQTPGDKQGQLPFEDLANRSLDHLRQAIDRGYFFQSRTRLDGLRETSDAFDSIRDLPEFQRLIAEINESLLGGDTTNGGN